MTRVRALALLTATLALCSFSFRQLSQVTRNNNQRPEVLYLPSGKGLNFISFGYRNTLAHFLWFQTNNYFGKHYRGNRDYRWLAHYCDLVTTLNPKGRDYYQFCGTMLAWEAEQYDASIAVYSRAIANYPNDWLFYYLRGFIYAFFANQDTKAKEDFIKSASLPNAHHFVARLASKTILAEDSIEEAEQFLKEAIEMANDENTKSILLNRLRQIQARDPGALKPLPWNRPNQEKK